MLCPPKPHWSRGPNASLPGTLTLEANRPTSTTTETTLTVPMQAPHPPAYTADRPAPKDEYGGNVRSYVLRHSGATPASFPQIPALNTPYAHHHTPPAATRSRARPVAGHASAARAR